MRTICWCHQGPAASPRSKILKKPELKLILVSLCKANLLLVLPSLRKETKAVRQTLENSRTLAPDESALFTVKLDMLLEYLQVAEDKKKRIEAVAKITQLLKHGPLQSSSSSSSSEYYGLAEEYLNSKEGMEWRE